MSLTSSLTRAGRKLRIAVPLSALLLLAGCHRTLNPWMSPVAVDVQGECAHFTGRIIANWAGRRVETKQGVRYRLSGPVTTLPPAVHAVVVEAITDGACAAHPDLLEIPQRPERHTQFYFPAFTATWRDEEGATRNLPVKLVHMEDAGERLVPEKMYPWPAWPWAMQWRNNIGMYTLEAKTSRAQLRAGRLEVKACAAGNCGVLRWPAQGR